MVAIYLFQLTLDSIVSRYFISDMPCNFVEWKEQLVGGDLVAFGIIFMLKHVPRFFEVNIGLFTKLVRVTDSHSAIISARDTVAKSEGVLKHRGDPAKATRVPRGQTYSKRYADGKFALPNNGKRSSLFKPDERKMTYAEYEAYMDKRKYEFLALCEEHGSEKAVKMMAEKYPE